MKKTPRTLYPHHLVRSTALSFYLFVKKSLVSILSQELLELGGVGEGDLEEPS